MGDDPAKFRRASGRPFQHEDDLRLLLHVEVGCAVAGLSVNRFCETFPFRDSQGRRFHKATLKRRYYQRKALLQGTRLPNDVIEIGRAHVCTPVTNAHLVCRLLLEKKKNKQTSHTLQLEDK